MSANSIVQGSDDAVGMRLRGRLEDQFRVRRIALAKANLIGAIHLVAADEHIALNAGLNEEPDTLARDPALRAT